MSVTMDDLVARVNSEAANTVKVGTASATGDGTATQFLVAPNAHVIVEDETFGAYVDGVEDTTGVMDYITGVYTFATAPADQAAITFSFSYQRWHEDLVEEAIEAGVKWLFPAFYSVVREEITTDGSTYEFDLDTPDVMFVTKVEFNADGAPPWGKRPRTTYDVLREGTTKYLKFFTAPATGTLRVTEICKPGWTLADELNVPDEAAHPIVSYAYYYLLTQKQGPRVYSDIAIVTQGQGTLSPRMMNDAASALMTRAMMQVQTMRMTPWSSY